MHRDSLLGEDRMQVHVAPSPFRPSPPSDIRRPSTLCTLVARRLRRRRCPTTSGLSPCFSRTLASILAAASWCSLRKSRAFSRP